MTETVTRANIVDALQAQVGFSRQESSDLVDSVFDAISETLATGDSVKISSFGSFVCRDKEERMGRNPKTGDEAPISARRVMVFKASPILKAKVNNETTEGLVDGFE